MTAHRQARGQRNPSAENAPTAPVAALAPAKVNLALHVTGRRTDGYHLLDSLVVFADVGDRLTARRASDLSLDLTGPFADALATPASGNGAFDDNLVLRAARLMRETWPDTYGGCAFTLDKHLPVAAGIGGGSADAAAALRAMVRLYGSPPVSRPRRALATLALALGADVPVCLSGHACRMRGIGEDITPLPAPPSLPGLLVNPGVAVSTAAVFARLELRPGEAAHAPLPAPPMTPDTAHWLAWLARQRNDLQPAAITEAPAIGECLAILQTMPGVRLARMSGSGATCFALFDDAAAARTAGRALADTRPDWWVRAVTLGDAPAHEQ